MTNLHKAQDALDLLIGLGVFAWVGGYIWYHALNYIARNFVGTKYLLAYVRDARGREKAKRRVDSTITVGTPENPYPEVAP